MNIEKYRFATDEILEDIFNYILNTNYNEKVICI